MPVYAVHFLNDVMWKGTSLKCRGETELWERTTQCYIVCLWHIFCILKYVFSLLQRTFRMSALKSGHNVFIVSVSAGLRTYKVCITFSCTWSLRLCVPLWDVSVLKLLVMALTQASFFFMWEKSTCSMHSLHERLFHMEIHCKKVRYFCSYLAKEGYRADANYIANRTKCSK